MGSIRSLKKEINYVLGDILDAAEVNLEMQETVTQKQVDAFNKEVFTTYDKLIADINNKKVENRKAHIKAIRKEFEKKAHSFIEEINSWE